MNNSIIVAWIHILALSVGLGGVWSRGRALGDSLQNPEDPRAIRRAQVGAAWWGIAVVVLVVTGVWRMVGDWKVYSAWFRNTPFLLKLALVVVIVALEAWPLMTLARWRAGRAAPDPRDAGRIEIISYVQAVLVVFVVLASVTTAHGHSTTDSSVAGPVLDTAGKRIEASRDSLTDDAPDPLEPSGTETVTPDDVALLTREIAVPLEGVNPATLHSNFDERRGGGTRQHQALDMMAPRGTPIHSAAKGRVLKLFTSANGGLMVYAADSSERFILMYAHLDRYADGLRDGATLERGQLIGYVGSTGNASPTAPHLHFAIARSADVKNWSRGRPIDPLPVLAASRR